MSANGVNLKPGWLLRDIGRAVETVAALDAARTDWADLAASAIGEQLDNTVFKDNADAVEKFRVAVAAELRAAYKRGLDDSRLPVIPTCEHDWQPRYDHNRCCKCGAVNTDSGWGIAKFMQFKSHAEAKFYQEHGRYPETKPDAL